MEYSGFERTFELVVSDYGYSIRDNSGCVRAGIAARPFRNLATIGGFPKF